MLKANKPPYDGLFITIEGGEGAGKSTLADRLTAQLIKQGLSVVHTREPGGTRLSENIRSLVLNKTPQMPISDQSELLLFLAARAQHLEEKILPILRDGKIVICERFHDSTIAYQGCARHLGMSYVEQLCMLACHGIIPDCTLLLDLCPEEGLKRVIQKRKTPLDRLEEEHLQFHREVRQGFLHLADKYPGRICVLDACQSQDEVFEKSLKVLNGHLTMKK